MRRSSRSDGTERKRCRRARQVRVGPRRAWSTGPLALAELVEATGLSRATAHRLAVGPGGPRPGAARPTTGASPWAPHWSPSAGRRRPGWPWGEAAGPALAERCATPPGRASSSTCGRATTAGVCLLRCESPHGLRTIVPVGARLPLAVGSAGRVLRDPDGLGPEGWVASVEERAAGVASVSAPGARRHRGGGGRHRHQRPGRSPRADPRTHPRARGGRGGGPRRGLRPPWNSFPVAPPLTRSSPEVVSRRAGGPVGPSTAQVRWTGPRPPSTRP